MRPGLLSVCGVILAASVLPALAGSVEGRSVETMRVRQLAKLCNYPTADGKPIPQCEARILGEIDGADAMQSLAHGRKFFCLPRGAGPREKFRVVRQYMQQHPETMSVDVGMMVAGALAYAYPCPHAR